jgi:hypothetical protein
MQPTVYLAGKIDKNDWRHKLVPGLRVHVWDDGLIVTPDFDYSGPFFKSCDHGCNHGANAHGAIDRNDAGESEFTQSDVVVGNMTALAAADLVFVYINAVDCYGTLFETGYAKKMGARIVILFAPEIPHDDFWYIAFQADAVYHEVCECRLEKILRNEVKETGVLAGRKYA